ncbi:multicopper oxidase domain-containing protein [Deinococcus sp.]|uniref:multicopper oxidase domain-containing protein n=1 Tax=Deinococcus sp. TaxID=47478 RepID=UPI003C7E40B6
MTGLESYRQYCGRVNVTGNEVNVTGNEKVRLLAPLRDFTGRTVYHCHVLEHGDRGMMGVLNVTARTGRTRVHTVPRRYSCSMNLAWCPVVVGLVLVVASLASASRETPACQPYGGQAAYERRVCESAVLTELERKYSDLIDELERGWHAQVLPTEEHWRGSLAACQSDGCLETAYRKRLGVLEALPSFPCVGRLNPAERAVCRNPALGRLDRELNLNYSRALDVSYTLLALRADQGRWRVRVQGGCGASASCLSRVYRARVQVLDQLQALAGQRLKRQSVQANSFDTRPTLPLKFTPMQQRSVQAQMGADFTDDLLGASNCLHKPVDLLDLNRDGHPDPVFVSCSGAHNEEAFFFLWQRGQTGEGRYRLVLTDYVGYFGYQQQDTRIHGLPMLRLVTHGSCCEHGSAYYAYDGRQYQAVACYNEHFLHDDFYVFEDLGKPKGGSCAF